MTATAKLRACLIFFVLFIFICIVRQMPWLVSWDQGIYGLAKKPAVSEIWLMVWYGITMIGNGYLVYGIVGLLGIVFLYKNHSINAILFIMLITALFLTNPVFKLFFEIARPESLVHFYDAPRTFSFPSGHAVNGVVLFYFVPIFGRAVFKGKSEAQETMSWYIFKLAMILGIAFSRVILGVHWFADIVGGIFWGFVICDLALYVFIKWFPMPEEESL